MKRLYHPLWTHLPATLAWLATTILYLRAWPWPERVPVHFDFHGRPDRWGSPWELVLVSVLMPLGFIALSIFFDENWARTESRKRFNWMSLFDEALVALFLSVGLSVLSTFNQAAPVLHFDWLQTGVIAALTIGAAVVLELLRPHRPQPEEVRDEDAAALAVGIAARLKDGRHWTYVENQDPLYIKILIPFSVIVLVCGSVLLGAFSLWLCVLPAASAALLLSLVGGLRVIVRPERLELRIGQWWFPFLNLRLDEISSAEVQRFSPLADYGGWGIRRGKDAWAYFFRGERGVMVTTSNGRKYLVGSDRPERLAAVLNAAARARS
jgi:hypothetical protein